MRTKKLLAALLLGVGLCFVPVLGYGEVKEGLYDRRVLHMAFYLLDIKVDYIMRNPTAFLDIDLSHDLHGAFTGFFSGPHGHKYPKGIDTRGKIVAWVRDTRRVFSYKSGISLLDEFKKQLEAMYLSIEGVGLATDMNTDIVAVFYSEGDNFLKGDIPLGYFYQGEYHLWEK